MVALRRSSAKWGHAIITRMKRDLELIRKIILAVDDQEHGYVLDNLKIENYSDEQIGYHSYLIIDEGLAAGFDQTEGGDKSPSWRINNLTSAGHDFADAARSDTIWNKAAGIVKDKAGTITIATMTELLVSLTKRALGI